ncbi:MAG: hypothetical protein CMK09_07245 [Ponticaulis sp.]|nr:hypothetical protein [Ponticaulis sp.]|tara:strand:+ start:9724 stop:10818 length:1095 start_codon:yes stop_codon:yes gene_type:complete
MIDRVFRVNASALNLRSRPSTNGGVLTTLATGQAVARLDDDSHDGWWLVFADIPGDGIYVGFVYSTYLEPVGGAAQPADEADNGTNHDIIFTDDSETREPSRYSNVHEEIHRTTALWTDGWHPEIPENRKFRTDNFSSRSDGTTIKRVVLHITGTDSLEAVKNSFLNGRASAHYLIDKNGLLYQFVSEHHKSWHSGIKGFVQRLYARGDGSWRKYMRYFSWSREYPSNARYYDENLNPVPKGSTAALVARDDGRAWPQYTYFDNRWGHASAPVGWLTDGTDPNNASIGIEILSYGSKSADPNVYTDKMYESLALLVDDICQRHQITKTRDFVVGHEDVNPVERWGWDPNKGFDWNRVLNADGLG